MTKLSVPTQLVGAVATFQEAFRKEAIRQGISASAAEKLFELVPEPLRSAPCFLDRMRDLWRYDYGRPLKDLPGGSVVIGTHMWPEVEHFVAAINCAKKRLGAKDLEVFLVRLCDRARHSDYLTEIAPILRVDPSCVVQHEVALVHTGETVDWLVSCGPSSLAIDVKYRLGDLVDTMDRIHQGARDPDGTAPAPTHDPSLILSRIASKFSPRNPSELIQGGWVRTEIMQNEAELYSAFKKLDPSRVHVVILGDWDEDVYVLARSEDVRLRTLGLLRARESRRFVFRPTNS